MRWEGGEGRGGVGDVSESYFVFFPFFDVEICTFVSVKFRVECVS